MRAHRSLEDRLDAVVIGVLRLCRRYAWSIADHVFKAVAWLIAIGVLRALYEKSGAVELWWGAVILGVLWAAAVAGQVYGVIEDYWQATIGRVLAEGQILRFAALLIPLGVMALIVILLFEVVIPSLAHIFIAVVGAAGR